MSLVSWRLGRGGGRRSVLAGARVLVVGIVLVVWAAPAWAASSHTAYAVNASSDSVTPIDTATNTPGAAIPVGRAPAGIAITPQRQDRLRHR